MPSDLNKNYVTILNNLKEKIRQARQRANYTVNAQLLELYWEIGNTILQQKKVEGWGTKVISRLAADLKSEFPDMKGLSQRNIVYMQTFAGAYPDFLITQPPAAQLPQTSKKASKISSHAITQPLAAQIPWTHHTVILDKVKEQNERLFYIQKAVQNGWSKSVLALQIESQLYERHGKAITNFENTLPKPQSDLANEMLKNPYVFDFLNLGEEAKERELENALIQNLKKFLLELGRGFAYVGNQFNLVVGGDDYFLDLLFYNTRLHCYVVVELKVGEFKPEYAGKLNFYLNTVDVQIKTPEDKPTIGVLLCKTPNKTVIEYALRGIDKSMGVADFELEKVLPNKFKDRLPTAEELEQVIEKETEEFNESLNPVDARLKAIKEKLKNIKTEEIQTPVTVNILKQLYTQGLKPLYKDIIEKLSVFDNDFHEKFINWSASNTNITTFDEKLDEFWSDEERLKNLKEFNFFYTMNGFKKAGTENLGAWVQLKFEVNTYWYGFTLVNHNEQQPFLKKLYHQSITAEDRQMITNLILTAVLDRIDWIIEKIESK